MIKSLWVFLFALYTTNVFAGYGGYIGNSDDRSYGSLSDPEYRGVVKFSSPSGSICTGGFVSKNLVITNSHCVASCGQGRCTAEFWNGSEYETAHLKLVAYSQNHENMTWDGTDWALLVSDKECDFYKPITPYTTRGQVLRGGFGILRIIKDEEIPMLKQIYVQTYDEMVGPCKRQYGNNYAGCINKEYEKRLKAANIPPLLQDGDNFKVQTCRIIQDVPNNEKMVKTDCDSSGGDSGAPLLRNGEIVGLNNSGFQYIFTTSGDNGLNANALKTENFYSNAQQYIAKYQDPNNASNSNNTTPGNNNITPGNNNTTTDPEQTWQQLLEQRLKDFNCD